MPVSVSRPGEPTVSPAALERSRAEVEAARVAESLRERVDALTSQLGATQAELAQLRATGQGRRSTAQRLGATWQRIAWALGWPSLLLLIPYWAARGRLRLRLREWKTESFLAMSGAFDAAYYATRYPDVRSRHLRHFVRFGAREGRAPNAYFDTAWYLERYPDVAASDMNPLVHYLRCGAAEGREPCQRSSSRHAASVRLVQHGDQVRAEVADTRDPGASGTATALDLSALFVGATLASDAETWGAYEPLRADVRRARQRAIAELEPAPPRGLVHAAGRMPELAARLHLSLSPEPRVSIIVPAYNELAATLECLGSVAAHTRGQSYELIVIDDASTDDTPDVLPGIRGLRYLRNENNLGFLRSCNRAARQARGRFLIFLNNDAQVTAGWLEPLLSPFDDLPGIGAVGPKILYPDGRLQEAGAMLCTDLSVSMVGLGDDPSRGRYSYARKVHYCSGTCLAVERARFEELGGFSEDLAPAYYEDCELQLRLHERGLDTLYSPDSVVVHHLSLTYESLATSGQLKKRQIVRNSQRLRERWGERIEDLADIKLLAFYLPQYHPFKENDLWWGRGFTEWTNVSKARPNFVGHYQPHLPGELGFYDLRLPEVMERQASLASQYGISGFCYYYYWFHGRRLLDMPLERLLTSEKPTFPFCLSWANENWTRRWDGGKGERDILMAQEHSDQDDLAVIRDLGRFLRHPSYIRIEGKPVVLIYRVGLFPDFQRTAAIWREEARSMGVGDLYLVRMDSFEHAPGTEAPSRLGLDAGLEFVPHYSLAPVREPLVSLNDRFRGEVHDYQEIVRQSARYKDADYPHFRCVMPGWDNTARRQNESMTFVGSSPGAYQAWLEEALRYTHEQNVGDERIVFINAWNEWAEGAHLEPDRRFGRAYLEATRNALEHFRRCSASDL